jgi:hypothetical protein
LAAQVEQQPIGTNSVLEPTTMPATKKRPSASRKSRAKKSKPVNTIDLEAESEASKEDNCWHDFWIRELIGFRQGMDEYFEYNVKEQGVNVWKTLLSNMIVVCEGFTKSSEQCRRKWLYVYGQYCNDKQQQSISRNGRKAICRFFDKIDIGFNNRTKVKKQTHGDAKGTANPCPLEASTGEESGATSFAGQKEKSLVPKNNYDLITDLLAEMTSASVKMSDYMARAADSLEGLRSDENDN